MVGPLLRANPLLRRGTRDIEATSAQRNRYRYADLEEVRPARIWSAPERGGVPSFRGQGVFVEWVFGFPNALDTGKYRLERPRHRNA